MISTLPPYLFINSIITSPTLEQSIVKVAKSTHTWMGESIKIALVFDKPFWRDKESSGTIFSNVGPIPEMYDHCNYEDSFFALKGFLNGSYFSLSREERLLKILNQLKRYFGETVMSYKSYEECIWRNEALTFMPYDQHILPHQNNGHLLFRRPLWKNKLFIGGTETAESFPGYMEGAIISAESIVNQILEPQLHEK